MDAKYLPLKVRIPNAIISSLYGTFMILSLVWEFIKSPVAFLQSSPIKYLPDCANSPSLGEHSYINVRTSTGDLVFHYVANGDRSKPLMLLLHGFPECWYSWRYQLKAFRSKYWVVAVDMRGFGGSGKPKGIENYRIDAFRDDIPQIIKALGYEKCVLVGHDMGGVLAWSLASLHPEWIDKLIILNAAHLRAYQANFKSSLKQFLAAWYVFWFQNPYTPEIYMALFNFRMLESYFIGDNYGLTNKKNLTGEDLEVYKFYFQTWVDREAPIDFYRAALRYRNELGREKIKTPVLLIWGEKDVALTLQLAQGSADQCEDCTIKYLREGSHWVQQDFPDECNRFMEEFLSQN